VLLPIFREGFARLYTLNGVNSDSGSRVRTVPDFDGIDAFAVDSAVLYPVLEVRGDRGPYIGGGKHSWFFCFKQNRYFQCFLG